jgi:hypothetical protein
MYFILGRAYTAFMRDLKRPRIQVGAGHVDASLDARFKDS